MSKRQQEILGLLKEQGLKQSWLAEKCGIDRENVFYHLRRAKELDYEIYVKFKRILGAVDTKYQENIVKRNAFPLINEVTAGIPTMIHNSQTHGEVAYFDYPESENCYALKVRGNSMSGLVDEGDIVLIDMRPELLVDNKVVVCLLKSGEQIIKRFKREKDLIIFYSENNQYEPRIENVKNIEFLHRVVKVEKFMR